MFEHVHTMTEYWDGPRTGIADFRGVPHAYDRPFDEDADEWANVYELRPVDAETLRLALEDWDLWLRWEAAFDAGRTPRETHPALPADRARHDEIAPILAARLAALPGPKVRATGVFRPKPGHANAGRGRWMDVEWTVVE